MQLNTQRNTIKHLQCMEVWGGNQSADSGVILPGMDAWVYSRPCENQSAGGDVHYMSTCRGGLLVRMVIADVAGHGAGVAETGSKLRLLMRRFINRPNQLDVVRSLNREFTAASASGVFATAVVMTFESSSNRLVVSNAGHPQPLWYQSKRRRWTLLQPETAADTGGIPWGIAHETSYEQFHAPLDVGDIIVCYTDALAESKGADGKMLGTDGLLRIARGIGNVNPSQLIPRLLSEIARNDPEYATRDDVTCLALRPNGLRPSLPLRDLLLVPIRWAMAGAGMKFGYSGWKRKPWDAPIENSGGMIA